MTGPRYVPDETNADDTEAERAIEEQDCGPFCSFWVRTAENPDALTDGFCRLRDQCRHP